MIELDITKLVNLRYGIVNAAELLDEKLIDYKGYAILTKMDYVSDIDTTFFLIRDNLQGGFYEN